MHGTGRLPVPGMSVWQVVGLVASGVESWGDDGADAGSHRSGVLMPYALRCLQVSRACLLHALEPSPRFLLPGCRAQALTDKHAPVAAFCNCSRASVRRSGIIA